MIWTGVNPSECADLLALWSVPWSLTPLRTFADPLRALRLMFGVTPNESGGQSVTAKHAKQAKSHYDENSVTAIAFKDMVIFAREGQGITAIRLERHDSGFVPREAWNNKENQMYMNSPVLAGNILFGLSPIKKGQFFALDVETGKTLWQGPGRMGEYAAILNLGGKVLRLLINDANLVVLPADAKEYLPAAQYTVAASPRWAHPVVIGRRILVKIRPRSSRLRSKQSAEKHWSVAASSGAPA